MVVEIFNDISNKLKDNLHYSKDEAQTIITVAISKYLDERYSISNRKMLGW